MESQTQIEGASELTENENKQTVNNEHNEQVTGSIPAEGESSREVELGEETKAPLSLPTPKRTETKQTFRRKNRLSLRRSKSSTHDTQEDPERKLERYLANVPTSGYLLRELQANLSMEDHLESDGDEDSLDDWSDEEEEFEPPSVKPTHSPSEGWKPSLRMSPTGSFEVKLPGRNWMNLSDRQCFMSDEDSSDESDSDETEDTHLRINTLVDPLEHAFELRKRILKAQ